MLYAVKTAGNGGGAQRYVGNGVFAKRRADVFLIFELVSQRLPTTRKSSCKINQPDLQHRARLANQLM